MYHSKLIVLFYYIVAACLFSCEKIGKKNIEKIVVTDTIFNTAEKVKKKNHFIEQFKKHWLDSTSAYYSSCRKWLYWTKPDSIAFAAILPSTNWDTVLFFTIWKVSFKNDFLVNGMPICASFRDDKIKFIRPKMIFNQEGGESDVNGFNAVSIKFKAMIIKSHYHNFDETVDPSYWFRFITDEGFFFDDYNKNGKKAEILKKSRKLNFEYLITEYYLQPAGRIGGAINFPKPTQDFSGWQ